MRPFIVVAALTFAGAAYAQPGVDQASAPSGPPGQRPTASMPAAQTPMGPMPSGQTPVTQMPVTQMPVTQMPVTQTPGAQTPGGQISAGQTPSAAGYVMQAGQSDAFEIQSGQLASAKAKRADVRAFGAKMIKDHTKSTQMVMAAATKSGLSTAPPPLRADQRDMLTQLQGASGEAFDSLYATQQLQAHEEALVLHTAYAEGRGDANLKKTAASIVPVVTMHLDRLRKDGGGTMSH